MTVNEYVKRWCDENYDIRDEEFYVSNAYYIADRQWALNGLKHGIFALIVAIISFFVCGNQGAAHAITIAFSNLSILTIAFWFYGIRNYNANSLETAFGIYIMVLILLFIARTKMQIEVQYIFIILGMLLYIFLTFVNPIKLFVNSKKIKEQILHMYEE
jgi:hypothetical protein